MADATITVAICPSEKDPVEIAEFFQSANETRIDEYAGNPVLYLKYKIPEQTAEQDPSTEEKVARLIKAKVEVACHSPPKFVKISGPPEPPAPDPD